uniref:Patatin like phospholipase domain containing 1 n=1 Tax=Phasianus colchicus TaxID=9054 RepID=A0A669QMT2_PHACC
FLQRISKGTPFSLSFSGSGFLVLYQIGVVQSLLELAPELLKSACKVYGSSAGSLIAAAVVCGIMFYANAREVRKTLLGPLSPKCSLLANIRDVLQCRLPEDSYQMASGRLHISLTRVVDGQNVMVSEFSSKEELIQALLCSCFLPIYCGFIPPSYRGVRYVDGGFTGLQPVSSLEEAVITVSPFTGELDICPRDCPAIFYCFQIFNGSIQISVENLCRISYALFPPSTMVSQLGSLPFALIMCWHELSREVRGSPSLEGLKTNVALRDVFIGHGGVRLDLGILEAFSSLNDSILFYSKFGLDLPSPVLGLILTSTIKPPGFKGRAQTLGLPPL